MARVVSGRRTGAAAGEGKTAAAVEGGRNGTEEGAGEGEGGGVRICY